MISNEKISSWGRLTSDTHEVLELTSDQLNTFFPQDKKGIAYGMGKSYGDVCLNSAGRIWKIQFLNHFIHFDSNTGILRCEAGVLLRDIQQVFIPRGWMLPVTPGTQLITVGGAIANDVHGKNHHVMGSFGNHIKQIKLLRTTGETLICTPALEKEFFSATVGGAGLTGIILEADIQLRRIPSGWLNMESLEYNQLSEFFELTDASEAHWENTVSWIDCTSKEEPRGIFMRANFIESSQSLPQKKPLCVPFTPPFPLINAYSLKLFNHLYFYLQKKKVGQPITVDYESYFYPLDNLLEWNKIYGPKGFFQYQSVVPLENGEAVTKAMMKEITLSGQGSFLSVLKTFGQIKSLGMLSFPMPGVTLALDFPHQGAKTLKLFDRLDAIVREAKGRLYLAKDARMPHDLFEAGYPRLNEFLKYRDPGISSALSRRLMGE